MGYMRHNAIIVTGFDSDRVRQAHEKAAELFPLVSPLLPSQINNYASFLVPPDGSKEGWAESDKGDDAREAFREWLRARDDLYLDWVEVQYGDEMGETLLIDDSAMRDLMSGLDITERGDKVAAYFRSHLQRAYWAGQREAGKEVFRWGEIASDEGDPLTAEALKGIGNILKARGEPVNA